ncbi:uncharacterized protein LOC135928459 [Gordionus sp. m RMFG-2023]|uniref:uncharacterized protein LOC135928459 n=1 Tax=Gordionus sp. m RMFG-2023 TaxID=3053472 RepID=UPI0031FDE93A
MASYVRVGNKVMKIEIREVDGSEESNRWVEAARNEAKQRYGDWLQETPTRGGRRIAPYTTRRRVECWACGGEHKLRFCPSIELTTNSNANAPGRNMVTAANSME